MKKIIIISILLIGAIHSFADNFQIKFLSYKSGTVVPKPGGGTRSSQSDHLFIAFYKNNALDVVKAYTPNGRSYWTPCELKDQTFLIDYTTFSFSREVSPDAYEKAKSIQKTGYFSGYKDCLIYANKVAASIGVKTPIPSDTVASPVSYVDYLVKKNNTFKDSRDGQTYPFVQIGNQTWMSENLNYNAPNSWCNQCETYGRLYTYSAAVYACPTGWHLPTDAEWTTLTTYLGGDSISGNKLKSTLLWASPSQETLNMSGFSALPGGYRFTDGAFYLSTQIGYYWSATDKDFKNAWERSINSDYKGVLRGNFDKSYGLSVRCIKNR